MQTQISELNFEGQNIFVGLDVHLKSWTVTILTESLTHKAITQPASAEALYNYLGRNFPGENYQSVYEAGYNYNNGYPPDSLLFNALLVDINDSTGRAGINDKKVIGSFILRRI